LTIASRHFLLGLLAVFTGSVQAIAAEPVGEWLVAEKTAHIRIVDCIDALWGVVAWEKDPGGLDEKNPNPARRTRPTLGIPILLGMKPIAPGKWDGAIYNSENGKTYSGGIRMNAGGSLRIFGCILGFLCGGETWTRANAPPSGGLQAPDSAICAGVAAS
jgi:uncharacterized protein (DUF2147 family)